MYIWLYSNRYFPPPPPPRTIPPAMSPTPGHFPLKHFPLDKSPPPGLVYNYIYIFYEQTRAPKYIIVKYKTHVAYILSQKNDVIILV